MMDDNKHMLNLTQMGEICEGLNEVRARTTYDLHIFFLCRIEIAAR
mgnify:CR=1 FL=1